MISSFFLQPPGLNEGERASASCQGKQIVDRSKYQERTEDRGSWDARRENEKCHRLEHAHRPGHHSQTTGCYGEYEGAEYFEVAGSRHAPKQHVEHAGG